MASNEMGLVANQRIESTNLTHHHQQLFFDENPIRFGPGNRAGDPGPKTRELGGFIDGRYFSSELRRGGGAFGEGPVLERRGPPEGRNWEVVRGGAGSSSGDDEEEDDDDEGDDEDEDDGDDDSGGGGKNSHSSGGIGDKIGVGNSKDHGSFGSPTREMIMKDGGVLQPGADVNRANSSENSQQGRAGHFQKMVTIAEHDGEAYYAQLLQGMEGSSQGPRDIAGDNGCGFSGRKEGSLSSDPGESLRAIFSDPITGALMDDAMILPCGHSFGSGGIQQVIKMKSCYSCSHPVSEDSVAPNLSLRTAVQAFRREEDVLSCRASKRRRERFEQEKGNYGDSSFSDTPRGRGVQFPFAVSDRVIIKGNKRTPQRFVGREAIVTTQCLNGWYVVKTLDNAESVKLQYRSLEKVSDNSSLKPISDKMTPNWL